MEHTRSYEALYNKYVAFRRCANAIIVGRDRELRWVGATTAKAAIMYAIDCYGGRASPGDIARLLVLRPHSVVGTLNRMEKDGLVRRIKGRNSRDRRITAVSLTKKGRNIWQRVRSSREFITIAFSALSNEELEQFESYLEILRKAALEQADGISASER